MAQIREIRTATFGQPPNGGNGHENEVLNPGRFQYGPKSTMGYYDSVVDPWTFVWWDELFATTDGSGEVPDVPDIEDGNPEVDTPDPTPETTWFLNRKNNWQSGPPVNNAVFDNALPKAGYWTKKGGPHNNDSKNDGGFQMVTGSNRPVLLFNMGHGNVASQGGSAETNVIGWDGYLSFDSQGIGSTTDCNMGVPHAYAMYTLDMDPYTLKKLAVELKAWIESQQNGETYTPSEDPAASHVAGVMAELQGNTRTITIEVAIRILKMIIKIINQMNSSGVVGGKLVDWDFIAELKYPTNANQYLLPPDHTVQNPSAELFSRYSHGKGGPHGPFRFSYTIDPDIPLILFLMKMRANGVLWHLSNAEGGNRTRIMRTTNFAHIHALGALRGIDDEKNSKYKQVLSYWDANKDPHSILDQFRQVDTRG
jgi:hypothetical protein